MYNSCWTEFEVFPNHSGDSIDVFCLLNAEVHMEDAQGKLMFAFCISLASEVIQIQSTYTLSVQLVASTLHRSLGCLLGLLRA